eukprot:scaffold172467_cov28-Tisochrysis_lutea.AAC.1
MALRARHSAFACMPLPWSVSSTTGDNEHPCLFLLDAKDKAHVPGVCCLVSGPTNQQCFSLSRKWRPPCMHTGVKQGRLDMQD